MQNAIMGPSGRTNATFMMDECGIWKGLLSNTGRPASLFPHRLLAHKPHQSLADTMEDARCDLSDLHHKTT